MRAKDAGWNAVWREACSPIPPSLPLDEALPSRAALMKGRSKPHPTGANSAATPALISSPRSSALPARLARCSLDWRRLWCARAFELQTWNSHRAALIFIPLQQDLQAGDQRASKIKWICRGFESYIKTALKWAPIGFCAAWIYSVNQPPSYGFSGGKNEGAGYQNDTRAAAEGGSLFSDSFLSLPFCSHKFKADFSMQMKL